MGNYKSLADELQALLIQRGYRCNIRTQRLRSSWHTKEPQPQYILHIRPQTKATIGGVASRSNELVKQRSQFKPVPFDPNEEVWCLRTEYGTLVTRRNGKVAIVGNCGRGFRLHPLKQDCLVLDFGGNILRHGPVDALQIKDRTPGSGEAPAKECPECQAVIHAAYTHCPDCGYEFPPPDKQKHDAQAHVGGVLSGEVTEIEYDVKSVYYSAHTKRGAPEGHPRTLRVDYTVSFNEHHSEWVCIEHPPGSFAHQKAQAWWQARSNEPCPTNVDHAIEIADTGGLAPTLAITVRSVAGEKYDRIVKYSLGEKPISTAVGDLAGSEPDYLHIPDDQIPF